MQEKSRFYIVSLLFLLSLGTSSPAQPGNIFVHNRPVVVEQGSGAVSVIHFMRLLEEGERDRVKLDGATVRVTDSEGSVHSFPLDSDRKLVQWPEALALLGYRKRVNKDTGVVDYHLASLEDQAPQRVQLEPESVRLERSMRRPGYLTAKKTYDTIVAKMGMVEDSAERKRVRRLGQIVAAQSPLSGLLWKFDVIKDPTPNALCTGEGHVLVTSGLLDLGLTDDELAGVLGHEVAHGVRRHAQLYEERFREYVDLLGQLQQMYYQYQQAVEESEDYKATQLKGRMEEKKKRFDFLTSYLKNHRDYNQDEEEESDVLGMQYAAAAGFDPEGEARALIKLKERSVELFGQSYNDMNRTHPPLDRRLKILETVRRRWREDRN